MIFHITTRDAWRRALAAGEYTAPSLDSEGFIHCSTSEQTTDTANMFFRGQTGLALLCIDETRLKAECKYEAPAGPGLDDPRTENRFPHIYGPINLEAVINVSDFPAGENGLFLLPADLPR